MAQPTTLMPPLHTARRPSSPIGAIPDAPKCAADVGASPPLTVGLIADSELTRLGMMAMLQPFGSRIKVMWSGGLNLDGGPVDLLLIGESFLPLEGNDVLGNALANPDAAAVVIITWDTRIASRQRALSMGCRGYLHNGLEAERVVSALERVMEGETMVSPAAVEASGANISFNGGRWPGDDHGLSRREAEIIGLITNGFSNDEIAQMLYLSINTIKSYVRSGYRKIGAERRPHAVRWGIEHGMLTL